jgi:hypothetical protein
MMPFSRFYNLIPTGINIPTGNQREELHDGIDADSTWGTDFPVAPFLLRKSN